MSTIKFDRHWLIGDGSDDEPLRIALLDSVLAFARRTGLTTILEGVETQAHLALARRLELDWVQGLLFSDQSIHRTSEPNAPTVRQPSLIQTQAATA